MALGARVGGRRLPPVIPAADARAVLFGRGRPPRPRLRHVGRRWRHHRHRLASGDAEPDRSRGQQKATTTPHSFRPSPVRSGRSTERRVGEEGGSTRRARWAPGSEKKKNKDKNKTT